VWGPREHDKDVLCGSPIKTKTQGVKFRGRNYRMSFLVTAESSRIIYTISMHYTIIKGMIFLKEKERDIERFIYILTLKN